MRHPAPASRLLGIHTTIAADADAPPTGRREAVTTKLHRRPWHDQLVQTDPSLEAWFLHHDLVFKVLGPEQSARLSSRMPHPDEVFAQSRVKNLLEGALAQTVRALAVPSLNELHQASALAIGQLVWVEQTLHFRGVGAAYYKVKRSGNAERATVWGRLSTDPGLQFSTEINASRCTSDTGAHLMTGNRHGFLLAYIEVVKGSSVRLRTVAIGQRLQSYGTGAFAAVVGDAAHVWPMQIDQFAEVDFTRGPKSDLELMRRIPEEDVKNWFAEIIGQAEVPKDWGGEQYDLWTRLLTIQGAPVRAAIAFKGPAAFHPMNIADLGKNGDQIQRLAESPADLLVVQHCHTITSRVEHMLRVYATSPHHVRMYMLIDGYATVSILKHFGFLPA